MYDENLLVFVTTRPNKRAENVRAMADVGLGILRHIFDGLPLRAIPEEIELQFPENHLNLCEVRALIRKLRARWPTKKVTIITHSEHLLTTVERRNIYIVDETIPEHEDVQYHDRTPSILDCKSFALSPAPPWKLPKSGGPDE